MSSSQGILFLRNENEEFKWFEHGDEDKDGKYVVEIEYGEPNGQGTYTLPDGTMYEGEFKEGYPNGQGTETYPVGKTFIGEFKDGKKDGQGTFIFPEGRKYVGEFMDGKRWKGTMYYKDGKIKNIYVNGKRTEP